MFFDVKNILGVGQARNRVRKAVERAVAFGLFCHSLLIVWYALHGHPATDTARRRAAASWYRSKTEPATLDMLTTLRRQIIAARFLPPSPRPATTQEILDVQQAWAYPSPAAASCTRRVAACAASGSPTPPRNSHCRNFHVR